MPTENFKKPFDSELLISSMGFGSYVGAPDDETDYKMYEALKTCVMSGGVNMIDTAINYRYQKSEKSIGKALNTLINKYDYSREEFFIASKGGFIPEDADQGIPGRVLVQDLVKAKVMNESDVIKPDIHCIHPGFLEHQLNMSLDNLGLETLDLYYLHNCFEMHGPHVPEQVFFDRLALAFEYLEKARGENKIKNYGLATWLCFRSKSSEDKLHLNFQRVVDLAKQIGG